MNSTLNKALLSLALVCVALAACQKQGGARTQNSNASFIKPEDRKFRLNQFQRIQGTRFLMAEITEATTSRSSSSSSSSGNSEIRNLVFLDGESLDSHTLFDSNGYIILATQEYPSSEKARDSSAPIDANVAQWLVYQVLRDDTNGDGRLDASDKKTIGVTDAGGLGYADVLSGLDQVLGITTLSRGQVVVVYSQGESRSASVIDLNNRKVVSTKTLIDLGKDVN